MTSVRRVAAAYCRRRVGCIIAAGIFGGHRALFKNRDRNYVPEVRVVHEVKDGVEVAYLEDDFTGWVEGLNEYGIGIVNAALMVSRDESERETVERTGKKLKDGGLILKALTQETVAQAAKSIREHKGGLKGHTVISDGKKSYYVEKPDTNDLEYDDLPLDKLFVRTNHGVEFSDAGYVEGEREKSSKSRQEEAEEVLADVNSPDDIGPALLKAREERWEATEMVRDDRSAKNMRTTTQMVLDLTEKKLILYLLPDKVKWLGLDDRMPEGRKAKIEVQVLEYKSLSTKTDGDTKVVKKGSDGLLPVLDPAFNVREIFKQLVLLEDHLFQPRKRCPDCIWKHLLTTEALAEEAVTLDVNQQYTSLLGGLADQIRRVQRAVQDGLPPEFIAQKVREVRKGLLPVASQVRVASQKLASYFSVGDLITYGKFQNKPGKLVRIFTDERGIPMIEIEPVPKGRKKNRTMGLFRVRHVDLAKRVVARWLTEQGGMEKTAEAKYKEKKEVPKADGSGTTTVYVYSERQIQNRNKEKAERVEKLRHQMKDLRKQVQDDLDTDDDQTRLTALAIALIDATFERVGNDDSADDGHFGVTGWLKKHLTFGKGKATIKYVGKSGVKHEKVVDDAKLVKALKGCCEEKSADDPILSFGSEDEDGPVKITSRDVNAYLKPFDVTAKDLRGFHANREMQDQLRSMRKKGPSLPKGRKEKDEILKGEFKKALEATAEAVGHEAATLRTQYLVPGLEDAYMKDGTVIDNLKDASVERVVRAYEQRMATTYDRTDPEMVAWVEGFFSRHPRLKRFMSVLVIRVEEPYRMRHPEASYTSTGIEVYPKFWELSPDVRDSVFAHEIGHHVLDKWGYREMLSAAEAAGVDPWDTGSLPYTQRNFDEAFADVFAEAHLNPSDLLRRYPAWAKLVQVAGGKVATKTQGEREDEEAERLVRQSPKKKPSRDDSKRERMNVQEDPDTDTKDKDLSRNYKDTGG